MKRRAGRRGLILLSVTFPATTLSAALISHTIVRAATGLAFLVFLLSPLPLLAQAKQVVEDKDVAVRFAIPHDWRWEKRNTTPSLAARFDLFIRCAPESEPLPSCYLILDNFRAPEGQTSISDEDRQKWRAGLTSGPRNKIVSARDVKVAGHPAFEAVVDDGYATISYWYVLVPGAGRLLRVMFYGSRESKKDYHRLQSRDVDAMLKSLTTSSWTAPVFKK